MVTFRWDLRIRGLRLTIRATVQKVKFFINSGASFYTIIFLVLHRPIDYILVKVLHYSLIRWERHAIVSQDQLTLMGELVWSQHSRPWLHHTLTLRSPSGTLRMGLATWVTMRVVVTTPLMVTLSLASEPEPPPLLGTLTGTFVWSGTSVMGLTRLSVRWKGSNDLSIRWMTLHTHRQRSKPPSTHRLAWCMTSLVTSWLILMLKSCKDLSFLEVLGA
jgi:hypothetical protein